ncbi:MAG TPA: hypothetical protein VGE84_04910 [Allosphingosinicella sp.]
MRILAIALLVLAGCSKEGGEGGNEAAPRAPAAGQELTLTGLYEGEGAGPTNQMCIIAKGGAHHFGLVVWGSGMHSCSGTGTATREGGRLRLSMAGDETCTNDATISGKTITLPAAIPDGCAYYCGARASLANARFTQKGTTERDAARAKDLVGESLCMPG